MSCICCWDYIIIITVGIELENGAISYPYHVYGWDYIIIITVGIGLENGAENI
jgi:hypothetical protein